jgi:hypothetical protein
MVTSLVGGFLVVGMAAVLWALRDRFTRLAASLTIDVDPVRSVIGVLVRLVAVAWAGIGVFVIVDTLVR